MTFPELDWAVAVPPHGSEDSLPVTVQKLGESPKGCGLTSVGQDGEENIEVQTDTGKLESQEGTDKPRGSEPAQLLACFS